MGEKTSLNSILYPQSYLLLGRSLRSRFVVFLNRVSNPLFENRLARSQTSRHQSGSYLIKDALDAIIASFKR